MTEALKISTSKYIKQGKVDVDGNIWDVIIPGAGTELRFSQASRLCRLYAARISNLEKVFDAVDADDSKSMSEEDLSRYEEYIENYRQNEQIIYEILQNTFKDGTDGNKTVKQWINDTPMVVITKAFEDLKAQTSKANESTDEQPTTSP
jgi:hypothetical protein